MTATDTLQETTLMGLHAVYPDRHYGISTLGEYFPRFDDMWWACNGVALYRFIGEQRSTRLINLTYFEKSLLGPLQITRLRIDSPMDLAVVAQGGLAVVTAYSIHLFVRVLRDPERVGAWLPRLVAGWHKGWGEAANAKKARNFGGADDARVWAEIDAKGNERIRALIKTNGRLVSTGLKPETVTALGAGEPPEELAEIDQQ
jgi:hypothetical protein